MGLLSSLLLVEEFLSERSQQVAVEGSLSSTAALAPGVPQGSVVGPTLIFFCINDLPKGFILLFDFADNTILYSTGTNGYKHQADLKTLEDWDKNKIVWYST